MTEVRTYKALDYPMKLYGFWPGDLAAIGLVFVVMHGVFNSLALDACTVGPALCLAWRARNRPPRYAASLLGFVMTPARFGVGVALEELPR